METIWVHKVFTKKKFKVARVNSVTVIIEGDEVSSQIGMDVLRSDYVPASKFNGWMERQNEIKRKREEARKKRAEKKSRELSHDEKLLKEIEERDQEDQEKCAQYVMRGVDNVSETGCYNPPKKRLDETEIEYL